MTPSPAKMTVLHWIMDVLASDMNLAEKAVTIAAVVLQTASNDLLADACRIDRRTVVRAKARPARDGWLHIGGVKSGGRGNVMTFNPGHPTLGAGVSFIHNEDAKEGQIATVLFGAFRDGSLVPTIKGWQNAIVSGAEKGGADATKGVEVVTLSVQGKGGGFVRKGGADALKDGGDAQKDGANAWPIAPLSASRARAQMESPSGIVNINRLSEESHPLTPSAPAASACVGEVLGPDEEHIGHGVILNCTTIRHPAFTISLPAIELGALAAGMSREEVRRHCSAHALQWAAEIEGGKAPRDVVPGKVANFLSASLMGVKNRADTQSVRMSRAAKESGRPGQPEESRYERRLRFATQAAERMGIETGVKS